MPIYLFYSHSGCRNRWDDTGDLKRGLLSSTTNACFYLCFHILNSKPGIVVSHREDEKKKKKKETRKSKTNAPKTSFCLLTGIVMLSYTTKCTWITRLRRVALPLTLSKKQQTRQLHTIPKDESNHNLWEESASTFYTLSHFSVPRILLRTLFSFRSAEHLYTRIPTPVAMSE